MGDRPKLTYFDMRGRAEPIRLMLRYRGVEFEDRRIVSKEEWDALLPRLPFGALPLYESGRVAIAQSHAIFRHLARAFGWLGADPAQDTDLDVTQEALAEAQEDLWRFAWVRSYPEKLEPYTEHTLAPRLAKLEAWLVRHGTPVRFWSGSSPTHVDFLAFCYLDELDAFVPQALRRFAELAAFRARIEALPAVAAYIASGARPIVFGLGIRGPKVDRRRNPEGRDVREPVDPAAASAGRGVTPERATAATPL